MPHHQGNCHVDKFPSLLQSFGKQVCQGEHVRNMKLQTTFVQAFAFWYSFIEHLQAISPLLSSPLFYNESQLHLLIVYLVFGYLDHPIFFSDHSHFLQDFGDCLGNCRWEHQCILSVRRLALQAPYKPSPVMHVSTYLSGRDSTYDEWSRH